MATTGLLMVLFVVMHLLGNLTIFAGPNGINAYAEKLHMLGGLVWLTRAVMVTAVVLHLVISVQITIENQAASPTRYAVDRKLKATFAGRTMIWTGLILGAFIVFHLLQFTFRATPGLVLGTDAEGRFDVFSMVRAAFQAAPVALLYLAAVVGLFLHLSHGVQSTFQSVGLNNSTTLPRFGAGGRLLSLVFLIGYGSIPALILFGVLAK